MKRQHVPAILIGFLAVFYYTTAASAETPISDCGTLNVPGETYILTQDIVDSPASVCMNITADNVTLDCQGHRIDGTDKAYSTGVSKSYYNNGKHASVKNCTLSDWYSGVNFYRSDGASVAGNRFEHNSTDVTVLSSPGSTITGNELVGLKRGIVMRSSDNSTISSNKLFGVPSDGLYTTYSIGGITVNYYANNVLIENNEITDTGSWGVKLYIYQGGGNTISGNVIKNTKSPPGGGDSNCIFLLGLGETVVKNNVAENCGISGIGAFGKNFTITGNDTSGSVWGIYVDPSAGGAGGGSTSSTVSDNIIHDNSDMGIYLVEAHDNTVSGNTVYNNGAGIVLYYADRNKILNNQVYGNKTFSGISIHASSDTLLEGNAITDNLSGVTFSNVGHLGDGFVMNNNTICGNREYDVYLDPYMTPGFSAFSGSENRCQTVLSWHDDGYAGCTHTCSNEPPVANAGPDQTIECAGTNGTTVTLDGARSSDPDSDALIYAWTWSGGSASGVNPAITLPPGVHTITLMVVDGKGGTSQDTVVVTVRDTIPPVTVLRSIAGIAGDNGWYRSDITITVDSSDTCSGLKEIDYSIDGVRAAMAGSTALFTVRGDGSHDITYGAKDNAGNSETAHPLTIKIDKIAPSLSLSASPGMLWPPNHKMVMVTPAVSLSDANPGATVELVSITSSEPDNGLGDGDTANDISINADGSISLRAERSGAGSGRVYTITYQATDVAGNTSFASAIVTVPHSK